MGDGIVGLCLVSSVIKEISSQCVICQEHLASTL